MPSLAVAHMAKLENLGKANVGEIAHQAQTQIIAQFLCIQRTSTLASSWLWVRVIQVFPETSQYNRASGVVISSKTICQSMQIGFAPGRAQRGV